MFKTDSTGWHQLAKFTPSGGYMGHFLGRNVSLAEAYAVIAAPETGVGRSGKGAVYIFHPPPTGWSTTNQKRTKLVAFDAETWDQFATSVSIQGDYIAVGAREDDDHGYSTGATYFYQNSGSAWTFMEKIVPDAVEEWNYLGSCVLAHNGYIYTGTYKKMQLTGRKKVDTNGLVVAEEIKLEEGAKLKLENGDIRIEPFNPKI